MRSIAFAGFVSLLLPAAVYGQGGWIVTSGQNKMDDTPIVTVSVSATDDIAGWVARARPRLIVRCVEDETELLVYAGMSPQPELGKYSQASVRIRFDNERPFNTTWHQSTSGNALFAPDPAYVLDPLRHAHRFLFEFTPIGSGPVVIEFNVQGLDKVVGRVATACRWEEKARAQAARDKAQAVEDKAQRERDAARANSEREAAAARANSEHQAAAARAKSERQAEAARAEIEREAKAAKATFDSAWAKAYELKDVAVRPTFLSGDGQSGHITALQGRASGGTIVATTYVVGEDGSVTGVQTDVSGEIDRTVRAAIAARRYSPAQRDGHPVSVRMRQLIMP